MRNWFARYERPISSLSLFGGFVFDAVTLKRVDLFWENIWVLGHLAIVAICIIWIHAKENKPKNEKDPAKTHFWLVNVLQFFFGGLLSTYLVFYFRSATLSVSWPFILILAVAFIANESFKRHFARLGFQISLFFLSLFSFAIFIVPVIVHSIGPWVFVLSGVVSLILMRLFLAILARISKERFDNHKNIIFILIFFIFAGINALYFTHLIPPIPLSLKDAGVYHSIERNNEGNYVVTREEENWPDSFFFGEDFHEGPNTTTYVYSAIFSPSSLNLTVVHDWEYYNESLQSWISMDRVKLPVVGGRDGGFRTYSDKEDLAAGLWRVNVETVQGEVIGRLRFTIIKTPEEPILKTEIKID